MNYVIFTAGLAVGMCAGLFAYHLSTLLPEEWTDDEQPEEADEEFEFEEEE